MPNWCEGSLKLRGKRDDILRFFREGVNAYHYNFEGEERKNTVIDTPKEDWMTIETNDDLDILYLLNPGSSWIYVEDTKRAFLSDNDYVDIYKPENPDSPCVAVCKVEQAWGFRVEDWEKISEKYNLDIRLFGVEQGMGFWEEITITNGKVLIDKLHHYDNHMGFVWECPLPWLGG